MAVDWEGILFGEMQFEWTHRSRTSPGGTVQAGQLFRGPREGAHPHGLQASRGGSCRRGEVQSEGSLQPSWGLAPPTATCGCGWKEKGAQARPDAVRGWGAERPRGDAGCWTRPPGSPPVP